MINNPARCLPFLARAQAEEGLIAEEAAQAIGEACADTFDIVLMAEQAAHAGTLAIPLVAELRRRLSGNPVAAEAVHRGATSQDVADTALMLQAKAGMTLLVCDLDGLGRALRQLSAAHAGSVMAGRTLLQTASPITFGLKAANWLLSVEAARARLEREAGVALMLQFGGAAGSRAGLRGKGAAVAARVAAELGLADPPTPWHARRDGVAGLGTALAILIGTLGKLARDVSLMAQGEVAEAFEPRVAGRGGSSAMAHKRNPTGCQIALSAALRAPGLGATLLAALPAEHERGLGGWQAEAPVVAELFQLAHGALAAMLPVMQALEVHPTTMAVNLAAADIGSDYGEAKALATAALDAAPQRG